MSWFQVFLYRHLYLGTRSILTHFFEMAWNHKLLAVFFHVFFLSSRPAMIFTYIYQDGKEKGELIFSNKNAAGWYLQ